MNWQTLQYDLPSAAFLFLLLIPIIWGFYFLFLDRQKKLRAFAEHRVLDVVLEKRQPGIFWGKVFLFTIAWIGGVAALMQPKGNERYVSTSLDGQIKIESTTTSNKATLRRKAHEVILLIDASASMDVSDVSGKKRLDIAKEIADDVIRHLKGENVSLFAFTGSTMQIVPSTLDYLFTRLLLQQISINEGETAGTDLKLALAFVKKLFFEKETAKEKTLIVLSDGGDTRLFGIPSEQTKEVISTIISPIAEIKDPDLHVYTVGIGSIEGGIVPDVSFEGHPISSSLEETLLRQLGLSGRGETFTTGSMSSFQIAKKLSERIAQAESFVDASTTPEDQNQNAHLFDFYFKVPLGVALLALAACLLIPDTHKKSRQWQKGLLFLIFLHYPLHAQPSMPLDYFEAGDFTQAQKEYANLLHEEMPLWKQKIIRYNIATAKLANQKWEEALLDLRPLARETTSPLLKQRAAANLIVARLMQLDHALVEISHDNLAKRSLTDYYEIFLLFRLAMAETDQAQKAWCNLQSYEGAHTCPPSPNLEKIRLAINKSFQQFQEAASAYPELQSLSLSEATQVYINHMMEQLKNTPQKDAKSILENAIAKEKLVVLLNQLQENQSKDPSIQELQASVLTTVRLFPEAVIHEQQTIFQGPENQMDRCQCQPWDEVIPLFYEGYQNANLALNSIEGTSKQTEIEHWQSEAIALWKEALNKMQTPSQSSPKQNQTQEQNQPPPQENEQKEEHSFYDVLRTLQEMEQDDRSQPKFEQTTGNSGEQRPW